MTETVPPAALNAFSGPIVVCANPACGKGFAPRRSWSRYCSDVCRSAAHNEARRQEVGAKPDIATLAEVLQAAERQFNVAACVTNSEMRARWQRLERSARHHLAQLGSTKP